MPPYSIDDLRKLFGLSSRQQVSKLAKTLDLVPAIAGKFSQEQMILMYQLHEHLQSGNSLAEFSKLPVPQPGEETSEIPETLEIPETPAISPAEEIIETRVLKTTIVPTSKPNPNNSAPPENPLGELIKAISQATTPRRDLLHNYHALEDAVQHQWIISSSNVRELTGTTPHGEVFVWANFEFLKTGKVGREAGWRIRNLHS
ncbi:MAG: hypothetical protein HC916_11270 [Coleofasciculaceae cyanobacterium SM2_1_6]|nr:hypothetical protein [Coleofasciculaceae cyanobacterium SM2_1_6]